jgi:hypothetical protein
VKSVICAPYIPIEEKQWMVHDAHQRHLKLQMHRTNALTSSDRSFEARVMAAEEEAQADETL